MSQDGFATWESQMAMYELLKNDTLLQNGVNGIFDGTAPDNTALPYVVIDSWMERQNDTLNAVGRELTCNVNVWSSYEGLKGSSPYVSRVFQILNHRGIITENWMSSIMRIDDTQALVEGNGDRHVVIRVYLRMELR